MASDLRMRTGVCWHLTFWFRSFINVDQFRCVTAVLGPYTMVARGMSTRVPASPGESPRVPSVIRSRNLLAQWNRVTFGNTTDFFASPWQEDYEILCGLQHSSCQADWAQSTVICFCVKIELIDRGVQHLFRVSPPLPWSLLAAQRI